MKPNKIIEEVEQYKYSKRKLSADQCHELEREASFLSSFFRMCGNIEKADEMSNCAKVLRKRYIQRSGYEENNPPITSP